MYKVHISCPLCKLLFGKFLNDSACANSWHNSHVLVSMSGLVIGQEVYFTVLQNALLTWLLCKILLYNLTLNLANLLNNLVVNSYHHDLVHLPLLEMFIINTEISQWDWSCPASSIGPAMDMKNCPVLYYW